MGNLDHVTTKDIFKKANTGLAHTYQMINVEDFEVRFQVAYVTIDNKWRIYQPSFQRFSLGTRRKCPDSALLSKYWGG